MLEQSLITNLDSFGRQCAEQAGSYQHIKSTSAALTRTKRTKIQRTVHIMWSIHSVHTVRGTNRTDLKYHGPVTAQRLEDQIRTTIIATLSVGNKTVICPMLHMTRHKVSNWLETCGLHFPKWPVGEHSLRDLIGWIIVLGIAPNNTFPVVIMSIILFNAQIYGHTRVDEFQFF